MQLWGTDHDPEDVEAACKKSLSDLKIDYFDAYLMHYPTAFVVDILTITPFTNYNIPSNDVDSIRVT